MAKKRGGRGQEAQSKQSSEAGSQLKILVDENLLRQAEREIKNVKLITPYRLSQKLGISISIAKRVLRELEKNGKVKLYSPGKRDPIYISS